MNKCSICGLEYRGYGNSARPINDGRCCNDCDHLVTLRRAVDSDYPISDAAMNFMAAANERMRIVMWIRKLSKEAVEEGKTRAAKALELLAQTIEENGHH